MVRQIRNCGVNSAPQCRTAQQCRTGAGHSPMAGTPLVAVNHTVRQTNAHQLTNVLINTNQTDRACARSNLITHQTNTKKTACVNVFIRPASFVGQSPPINLSAVVSGAVCASCINRDIFWCQGPRHHLEDKADAPSETLIY